MSKLVAAIVIVGRIPKSRKG
ncbi:hypothetical protein CY0110_19517 [Crocosphaera chwakensis CCY0110]|uniref:Uncharacterized protein n=1 Tax=Crocosphaera chwakensis CCY0110 TaxID=391612 RepID=A3IJN5_9CHRO|nr:hypothetical protein CY0110_19517 [Crocosphaera chwakensis CCY0110]